VWKVKAEKVPREEANIATESSFAEGSWIPKKSNELQGALFARIGIVDGTSA